MKQKLFTFKSGLLTKLLLSFTLLLAGVGNLWADETLTYYPKASSGTEYSPFRFAYSNKSGYKSEFIIPSKDLSAMAEKKITKLTFYNRATNDNDLGTYKISLVEVSDSVFSENVYLGDYSNPVYEGTIDASKSTITITLSEDFVYSGTKHLLIGFYCNGDGNNTSSIYFNSYNFGSGVKKVLYPNYSGSATSYAYVPKTTFTYEDAGGAPVSVDAPTALGSSNVTPVSADISWTSSESKWQLSYSTTSGDHSTTTSDFTSNPYTLSGLTPSTKYYVSVRAKNGSTYSDWSDEINFTTGDAVAVSEITLDNESLTMLAGDNETLTATVSPDNATYKTLTWESSDESVATVADGEVTAVAPGTATITVSSSVYPSVTATCEVTVSAPQIPTGFKASSIGTNYAYLTWTNVGDADKWQIKYGTSSGNLSNQTSDITDKPHQFTNLTPNTTYYASIRSKLGTAYSDWSDEISFSTPAVGSEPSGGTEITENFDSDWPLKYGYLDGVKDGWGYSNGYARYTTNTAHRVGESGNGLYVGANNSPYQYIITPYIEAGSTISFYYKFTSSGSVGYIRFYKATKIGDSYLVNSTTQYGSTLSGKSTDVGEMTELASPITITDGGYVAIYLHNAAIDNFTYTYLPNVSVVTDNYGYATFASSSKLDLTTTNMPSGLNAYKAEVKADEGLVKFTELSKKVPANTGVLLKGAPYTEYRIAITSESDDVDYTNNFLVNSTGGTFDAKSGYTYFAMKKNSDPLVFATFNPSSVAIPSNKAYLKVLTSELPPETRQLVFSFDEDKETGINSIENGKWKIENEAIYNLAGQRVEKPVRGLYIVNGKKMVVK